MESYGPEIKFKGKVFIKLVIFACLFWFFFFFIWIKLLLYELSFMSSKNSLVSLTTQFVEKIKYNVTSMIYFM